jgi:hypothetical protein
VAVVLGSVVAVDGSAGPVKQPEAPAAIGRLRRLARVVLDEQGVAVERLRWMGEHSNYLFRCDTAAGDRLVVRMCLPGGRSDAELDAELGWLAALARETDLTVPAARFSTHVTSAELPAGGRCIGFEWVWGRHCEARPSRRLVADLGRVLAVLHAHARRFRPPRGFTRPRLDIGRLTLAGTPEAARLARQRIDPATRRLLGEVADRVQAVLAELGSGPQAYGLVHADLHLGNVLDHHGEARPLDFDDASWGRTTPWTWRSRSTASPSRCSPSCWAATERSGRCQPATRSTPRRCWRAAGCSWPRSCWPTGCQQGPTWTCCGPSPRAEPSRSGVHRVSSPNSPPPTRHGTFSILNLRASGVSAVFACDPLGIRPARRKAVQGKTSPCG